jgi:1,2-diacylglycerol 3-alpha-glucosyltransferase
MRIVLFTECYRPIQNGVVVAVEALSDALRAQGHEVSCVTPMMPRYRETSTSVVRVPSLPLPTSTAYRLALPLFAQRRIARIMGGASIVHAHSPFVTGWVALRAARRWRVPLVFTYHTRLEDYAHYIPFEASATRRAVSKLTRTYANAADAVIVPTQAMVHHLRSLGVTSRIEVVPSGIDVDAFARGRRRDDIRRSFGVGAGDAMVLCVSRLAREKNLELALETVAALPPSVRLIVIGDGPHAPALRRAAMRAGVADRVHFALELPHGELPDVYASADAFLFTSESETQGLVLAEALAAGLPIAAVETPATRDVLGACGLIVPPNAAALAAAVRALTENGERAGGRTSAWRFERRVLAAKVAALYDSLLEARAAG